MSGPAPRPLLERWRERVLVDESGCWLWSGRHDKEGYARIDVGSRTGTGWRDKAAHIVAWELHHGEAVPASHVVHHTCEVKGCVNPGHLEAKTRGVHQSDHHRGELCRAGLHSMEGAYVSSTGKRSCRACSADRARRRRTVSATTTVEVLTDG